MKTYLWIEDKKGKASYTFWEMLMKQVCPWVVVESKKNNSELVKAVKALSDDENKYIIVFDDSFDNVQIYQEQKRLQEYVGKKHNVFMMRFICFEYILLEFDKLFEWIYASDDEFLVKRASAIQAREKFVNSFLAGEMNYKKIQEVIEYDKNIENHNVEQLAAKLLFDLTRNTGFEVTKGKIGDCWISSCCEWNERQDDDICGLDQKRLSVDNKMREIYKGTSLKNEFKSVELEVVL